MKRPLFPFSLQLPRPGADAGLTLMELLVSLLISGLLVPLIWTTIHGSIQFFEATTWQAQLQRDLDRLTALLDGEAEDACLFGTNAGPGDCSEPTPNCSAADNQLRMRVTLFDANNVPTGQDAVITYSRDDNNDLRRTGPTILTNGRLDPTNTVASDQLVMRGVKAFNVTPNEDCSTATIEITVKPLTPSTFTDTQGFCNPVTRTIGLRTGSRPLH